MGIEATGWGSWLKGSTLWHTREPSEVYQGDTHRTSSVGELWATESENDRHGYTKIAKADPWRLMQQKVIMYFGS